MLKDIIDIEAALKLKRFSFRISSQIKGMRAGIHKSRHRGISPDFLEYKEYSAGDDLKNIDWRLYGRLDRYYVKKFEDEVNINWRVMIDRSGSMGYGAEGKTKLDYAKRLSATLAYLLLKQGDAVGMADFSEKDSHIMTPRLGTENFRHIAERLESLKPEGRTVLRNPVLRVLEKTSADSAFVIVSDLLTDLLEVEESLKLLKSSKKEVIIFHLLHSDEINFNFDGSIEFEDMEDETKVLVDADAIRSDYKQRFKEFMQKLELICHENGSRYVLSPCSAPVDEVLIQIAER